MNCELYMVLVTDKQEPLGDGADILYCVLRDGDKWTLESLDDIIWTPNASGIAMAVHVLPDLDSKNVLLDMPLPFARFFSQGEIVMRRVK